MSRPLEYCCSCHAPTGRAGIGEDSIYYGEFGPFCESCSDDIGQTFAARISALEAALKPFADKVTSLDASKKLFDPDYGQTKDILYAGEDAYRRAKAALEV